MILRGTGVGKGVSQHTSFKFNIAQTRGDGEEQGASAGMMTGKVEMILHELGEVSYQMPKELEKKKSNNETDLLYKLSELKDAGILTEKEFTEKKKEILSRI